MIDILQNIGIALLLGALIGLEREYTSRKKKVYDFAGIRTFPFIALFGFLSSYLGDTISIHLLIVGFIIMGALVIIAYHEMNKNKRQSTGATSEVAALLTFLIGVMVHNQLLKLATILAVTIAVILYARTFLHRFAYRIKETELEDTLKFAVVAFVILPFLPNQGYGPLEIFNPFIIWLMVVFVSGISFVGYILMKWIGERGVALAGVFGGLISSTAVTMSFSDRSKKQKRLYSALALGVILANGIMFLRILIEVFVLNRPLFYTLLLPMGVLALVTAVFSYFLLKRSKEAKGDITLGSPFTIKPALTFGLIFALVLALVKVADVYLSSKGVYIVSMLSGIADVDAITVSLSQLAGRSLEETIARNGIIIAALTNVAVKGGIALWFGGKKFGRLVASFYAALIAIGVLFFLV